MVYDISLSSLCDLYHERIHTDHLKVTDDTNPPEKYCGMSDSIINTRTAEGSFFGMALDRGIIKINAPVNDFVLPAAFSLQNGGYIQFNEIYGPAISYLKSGGILKGGTVRGNNFCKGMTGGVTDVYAVYGDGSFNEMKGGIVLADCCYGLKPFKDMSSGIALVREFKKIKNNNVGAHEGGTIITTDNSFSGDDVLDESLLAETIVFSGRNASKQLTNFSEYLLTQSPLWLAEEYNKHILNCNFKNPEAFSEFHHEDAFNESLKWLISTEVEGDYPGEKIISDLLVKFIDLHKWGAVPAFYKKKIHSPIEGNESVDFAMDYIRAFSRNLRRYADTPLVETGYRGLLEVNKMSPEEIFAVIFEDKGAYF